MYIIPVAAVMIVFAIVIIYTISKTKHPVKTAFKSAAGGVIPLLLVNLTAVSTGCYIAINFFTVFVAVFLSLPGVIGMLLLNIIFI